MIGDTLFIGFDVSSRIDFSGRIDLSAFIGIRVD